MYVSYRWEFDNIFCLVPGYIRNPQNVIPRTFIILTSRRNGHGFLYSWIEHGGRWKQGYKLLDKCQVYSLIQEENIVLISLKSSELYSLICSAGPNFWKVSGNWNTARHEGNYFRNSFIAMNDRTMEVKIRTLTTKSRMWFFGKK